MPVPNNPDVDALLGLLEHPGWHLLTAFVDSEWGAVAFGNKVARSLAEVDPAIAVVQLQQATVAQKAVIGAMRWPVDRLNTLKRLEQPHEPTMSRRGPLL